MPYTPTERDREIVRFALAYLSANIEDFLDDWPDYFTDGRQGDYPLLEGQPPTGEEVTELYGQFMNGGQA